MPKPPVTIQAVDSRGTPLAGIKLAMQVALRTPSGASILRARPIGQTSDANGTLTRTLEELQTIAGEGVSLANVRIGVATPGCDATFVELSTRTDSILVIAVPALAEIQVRCVDRTGKPRSGAQVWLANAEKEPTDLPKREQAAAFTLRASHDRTNEHGVAAFAIAVVANQEFELRAAFGPHFARTTVAGPIQEGAPTRATIVLDGPTTRLQGIALAAPGTPLRNVPLQLQVDGCCDDARTTTDSDGRFGFELAQQELRGRTAVLHELLGGTMRSRMAFARLEQTASSDANVIELGSVTFANAEPVASGTLALPPGRNPRLTQLRVEERCPGGRWRPSRRLAAKLANGSRRFVIHGIPATALTTYRLRVANRGCARCAPLAFEVGDHALTVQLEEPCSLVVHQRIARGAAPTILLLTNEAGIAQPMTPVAFAGARTTQRLCWSKLAPGRYQLQRMDTKSWSATGPAKAIEIGSAHTSVHW